MSYTATLESRSLATRVDMEGAPVVRPPHDVDAMVAEEFEQIIVRLRGKQQPARPVTNVTAIVEQLPEASTNTVPGGISLGLVKNALGLVMDVRKQGHGAAFRVHLETVNFAASRHQNLLEGCDELLLVFNSLTSFGSGSIELTNSVILEGYHRSRPRGGGQLTLGASVLITTEYGANRTKVEHEDCSHIALSVRGVLDGERNLLIKLELTQVDPHQGVARGCFPAYTKESNRSAVDLMITQRDVSALHPLWADPPHPRVREDLSVWRPSVEFISVRTAHLWVREQQNAVRPARRHHARVYRPAVCCGDFITRARPADRRSPLNVHELRLAPWRHPSVMTRLIYLMLSRVLVREVRHYMIPDFFRSLRVHRKVVTQYVQGPSSISLITYRPSRSSLRHLQGDLNVIGRYISGVARQQHDVSASKDHLGKAHRVRQCGNPAAKGFPKWSRTGLESHSKPRRLQLLIVDIQRGAVFGSINDAHNRREEIGDGSQFSCSGRFGPLIGQLPLQSVPLLIEGRFRVLSLRNKCTFGKFSLLPQCFLGQFRLMAIGTGQDEQSNNGGADGANNRPNHTRPKLQPTFRSQSPKHSESI